MAKRRKSRRKSKSSGSKDIKKLLVLAGLGFGLYMVMKDKALPMVASVDDRMQRGQFVTEADLRNLLPYTPTADSDNQANA